MTKSRIRPAAVPLDRAGAGDLIGYNRRGQALYLPGGGAPDDGDPDDEDPDDDDLGDEPAEPPAPKQNLQTVLAENARMKAAIARNNRELKARRQLGQFTEKHGITDLDTWLADLKVDRETGKPIQPPADAPPALPDAPSAPAGLDEAEVARRVALEVAKRDETAATEAADRQEKLSSKLRHSAALLALKELGFNGTFDKAVRVMDIDALDLDEDGEVTGAKEAAEQLKSEIPEWFRQRPSPGSGRQGGSSVDGPDKPPPKDKPKKWDQRVADQLSGR